MIDIKKISRHRTLIITVTLIVLWNMAAWVIAERNFLSRADALIEQETRVSQERAADLADSIRRYLNHLHGIPDLLSKFLRVKWAVSRFGADVAPSSLPLETRIKRWTANPALNDLSQYLLLAAKSLDADLVYVVNAAGDCIAASNWDTPGTSIGTNFAEREFFKKNKNGQRGMQYAVGKTTHIPGIYMATPVVVDGVFLGSVVAKADVPKMSYLIKQWDAFVADSNDVIILARNKEFEIHALPDASVHRLTEQERFDRYRRDSFPTLKIAAWGDQRFPTLKQVEDGNSPHILAVNELSEYGLHIYIDSEVAAIPLLSRDRFWFALLIGALGSLLILGAGGTVHYFQSIMRSRAQLWRQANFDTLTGLPNRDMFQDRLAQEIKKSKRSGQPLALLLIDLDRFKEVNDTLGHDMGDILLQEAAHRIVVCVRGSDTVSRLGGDEFTIVLAQLADFGHAEDVARKIIARLAEPFHLRGEVTHVTASLGITLYPNDASDIDDLIKNADQAMYAAKSNGRNGFSYFTASLQQAAQKRLHLTNDLRAALAGNQFRVYFQPIIELSTGRVNKAEALLRWMHPVHGMISPLDFIPLAEETRFIIDIGRWVRNESAVWCKRWNDASPEGFQVSINKSPVEFMDESTSSSIATFLDEVHGQNLSGKNFVFEITEGLLLNTVMIVTNKLMELRDAGIQVAIDDFGTGYSTLSYLKKFDIDYLKIDKSFIHNLEQDPDDLVLCEAIIVMAHKLGLKVVAEGVETEQQRDLLIRANCDYAQGYLYSRAVPPEQFETWLKDRNRK
ncbi:MAG: EAL domain-containing protein [Gallionella sp.]